MLLLVGSTIQDVFLGIPEVENTTFATCPISSMIGTLWML
jgi:hypothetical protein